MPSLLFASTDGKKNYSLQTWGLENSTCSFSSYEWSNSSDSMLSSLLLPPFIIGGLSADIRSRGGSFWAPFFQWFLGCFLFKCPKTKSVLHCVDNELQSGVCVKNTQAKFLKRYKTASKRKENHKCRQGATLPGDFVRLVFKRGSFLFLGYIWRIKSLKYQNIHL